jgi:hypothetical protein
MPELAHEHSFHDPHVGHEESDISVGAAATFGAVVVLLCIFALVCVSVLMRVYGSQQATELAHAVTYPLAHEEPMAQGPGIQANPPADLASLRLEEDAVLHNYAWVDREQGIVRIPIARAMELLVQKGLPSRANPPSQEGPMYPEASSSGRMMERFVP